MCRATDREVVVVAAVLAAGSEKAAAQPARPVALDRQAPLGERAVQGGSDDHGAAGMDPCAAAAGA